MSLARLSMAGLMRDDPDQPPPDRIAVIVKGYPRLSETFIAQELYALEQAGLKLGIFSLRHPTDRKVHSINQRIAAPVSYLPEYLHQEPIRVLRGWWHARRLPGYRKARKAFLDDLYYDRTRNRLRRWGQALVLAAELPPAYRWIYIHFIHTPASVGRYAALIRALPYSLSAHAKDIHTTPPREIRQKLADCQWLCVCSAANAALLRQMTDQPEKIHLLYHGLDFKRFPARAAMLSDNDGTRPDCPVQLLSVGRAVSKKGFDTLLLALTRLPEHLSWRWTHIGGGPLLTELQALAGQHGLADRITWAGAQDQEAVLAACRNADIFVLPSRVTADGDRDGLPNVLMEAASQSLCLVSTPVGAIGELIHDHETGRITPSDNPAALAAVLQELISTPDQRHRLGQAVCQRLQQHFAFDECIKPLPGLFVDPAPHDG